MGANKRRAVLSARLAGREPIVLPDYQCSASKSLRVRVAPDQDVGGRVMGQFNFRPRDKVESPCPVTDPVRQSMSEDDQAHAANYRKRAETSYKQALRRNPRRGGGLPERPLDTPPRRRSNDYCGCDQSERHAFAWTVAEIDLGKSEERPMPQIYRIGDEPDKHARPKPKQL